MNETEIEKLREYVLSLPVEIITDILVHARINLKVIAQNPSTPDNKIDKVYKSDNYWRCLAVGVCEDRGIPVTSKLLDTDWKKYIAPLLDVYISYIDAYRNGSIDTSECVKHDRVDIVKELNRLRGGRIELLLLSCFRQCIMRGSRNILKYICDNHQDDIINGGILAKITIDPLRSKLSTLEFLCNPENRDILTKVVTLKCNDCNVSPLCSESKRHLNLMIAIYDYSGQRTYNAKKELLQIIYDNISQARDHELSVLEMNAKCVYTKSCDIDTRTYFKAAFTHPKIFLLVASAMFYYNPRNLKILQLELLGRCKHGQVIPDEIVDFFSCLDYIDDQAELSSISPYIANMTTRYSVHPNIEYKKMLYTKLCGLRLIPCCFKHIDVHDKAMYDMVMTLDRDRMYDDDYLSELFSLNGNKDNMNAYICLTGADRRIFSFYYLHVILKSGNAELVEEVVVDYSSCGLYEAADRVSSLNLLSLHPDVLRIVLMSDSLHAIYDNSTLDVDGLHPSIGTHITMDVYSSYRDICEDKELDVSKFDSVLLDRMKNKEYDRTEPGSSSCVLVLKNILLNTHTYSVFSKAICVSIKYGVLEYICLVDDILTMFKQKWLLRSLYDNYRDIVSSSELIIRVIGKSKTKLSLSSMKSVLGDIDTKKLRDKSNTQLAEIFMSVCRSSKMEV